MNPMKILLVDDSKSARYALRLQLQRYGTEVETMESAESALAHIREAPPDAVFMDHTMPGMNGFEALEILKTTPATAHIPVVMCTSNEDPEFIAQAQRKGAFAILSKASAAEKLPDLLQRLERGPAGSQPAPTSLPAAAGDAAAIARGESERFLEERLEGRVRALIEPMLAQLRQQVATEAAAKAETTLVGRVESLAQQLSAEAALEAGQDLDARLSAYADRIGAESARRADEALNARIEAEAERLHARSVQVQSEQAQRTTQRLASELIPQLVRDQIEEQRQHLAQTVQQMVDASVDALVQDPDFLRRTAEAMQETALSKAEEAARNEVRRLSDTVSAERASEVADGMLQAARSGSRRMVLLAAGAALVGMASAAAVYLLLT